MTGFRSQVLGDGHHVKDFTCGMPALDCWLVGQARRAQEAGTARTYVWTRPDQQDVLAYYSVAPTQVVRGEVPRSLSGGYSTIPAYLLARLALHHTLHGRRLGAELLVDALGRIVEAAAIGGGRLIVVDALDDQAVAFYRRHDFIQVRDSSRLYLKVATASAALAGVP